MGWDLRISRYPQLAVQISELDNCDCISLLLLGATAQDLLHDLHKTRRLDVRRLCLEGMETQGQGFLEPVHRKCTSIAFSRTHCRRLPRCPGYSLLLGYLRTSNGKIPGRSWAGKRDPGRIINILWMKSYPTDARASDETKVHGFVSSEIRHPTLPFFSSLPVFPIPQLHTQ